MDHAGCHHHNSFSYGEFVLSGTYQCTSGGSESSARLLVALPLVLYILSGILGLSFTVWMAFKHFHQIKWWITEDRVTALIKTHVVYFAGRTRTLNFELPSCWGSARVRFTAAACLNLCFLSPEISNLSSVRQAFGRGHTERLIVVSVNWFSEMSLKERKNYRYGKTKSWCWWCGRLVFYYLNVFP